MAKKFSRLFAALEEKIHTKPGFAVHSKKDKIYENKNFMFFGVCIIFFNPNFCSK
jgi:hypothetical protein